MLSNAYFLAKIGADTAENEQHFAEILPIRRPAAARPANGLPASTPPSSAKRFTTASALPLAWTGTASRVSRLKTVRDLNFAF